MVHAHALINADSHLDSERVSKLINIQLHELIISFNGMSFMYFDMQSMAPFPLKKKNNIPNVVVVSIADDAPIHC